MNGAENFSTVFQSMKKFFPTLLLLLSCGLSAVAQPSGNPLVFGENRLTLITPTLFRLEFARDGKFIDDPTIFAYDRSNLLPADRFEVQATATRSRPRPCVSSTSTTASRSDCTTSRPTTSSTARKRSSPTAASSATTSAVRSKPSTASPVKSPCRTGC